MKNVKSNPSQDIALLKNCDAMYDLFCPRRKLLSSISSESNWIFELMKTLLGFKDSGDLVIQRSEIRNFSAERSDWINGNYRMCETTDFFIHSHCVTGPGDVDLQDQRWSAYRYLRKSAAKNGIKIIRDFKFCCWNPDNKESISAGNLHAETALRVIVKHKIKSFGLVGCIDRKPIFEKIESEDYKTWQLTNLIFSDQAIAVLKEKFDREDEKTRIGAMEIMLLMREGT
jgi:hypothetical protein